MLEAAPVPPVSQRVAGETLSRGQSREDCLAAQQHRPTSTVHSPAPVLSVAGTLFHGPAGHGLGFPPEGKERARECGLQAQQAKGHTCREGYSR